MFVISWINHHIFQLLNKTSLTSSLISHDLSAIITVISIYLLFIVLGYESILHTLIRLEIIDKPGKEFFIDKPVHCAHVYIKLNLVAQRGDNNYYGSDVKYVFKKPIIYNLEFGPLDYDARNPELGTTLEFTKLKVLKLFKNSQYYNEHPELKRVGIEGLKIFHHKKQLVKDDEFLCLLGVETGHKIDCFIDLN